MKKIASLAAALLLVACASEPARQPEPPATAESASQAIAAAETSAKTANDVGYQWRDTEALIKQAKEAAQKQDFTQAVKLARQADSEGRLAYEQYQRETAAFKQR